MFNVYLPHINEIRTLISHHILCTICITIIAMRVFITVKNGRVYIETGIVHF